MSQRIQWSLSGNSVFSYNANTIDSDRIFDYRNSGEMEIQEKQNYKENQ